MANVIEIVIKQTGQGSAIVDVNKALGGMKGAGDTAIASLLSVGKALTGIAGIAATALIGFGVSGVKAAMDVDHQLAQIAATLGTTKDAAMPLKDLMTELALDPKLTVNVTQAGEAIEVLAANGLELQDILEGGARGAVQLANATGSDFATAATIATDAMQQFGFEANQLETVADGIAGVLVKSKFSADDYALALSNAGGIAGSLGVELSDFNTVLAATSSQFASGSDAGTSFKTLLTRLAKPTDEVAAAMQQYGISIFDAEGKMKPFAEIAGQLNKVFNESFTVTTQVGGATKEMTKAAEAASAKIGDLSRDIGLNNDKLAIMQQELANTIAKQGDSSTAAQNKRIAIQRLTNTITDQQEKLAEYQSTINAVSGAQAKTVTSTNKLTEEQKAALATTLGGTDAMRTILGLAEMTEEQFNSLSAEVNKSGLASQAAATRVDSLTGAWEIFKGIIEAVQIQVGDKFLPIIRRVTEAVSVWASENSGQVVAFFGAIATGIDFVITKGTELFNAFQTGGAGGLMAAIGLTPEQIGMITAGFTLIIENVESFKGALLGIGAVLGVGIIASLVAGLMALLTPINLLIAGAALLGAAWMGNWGNIQGIVGSAVTYITTQFNTLMALLQPSIVSFQESFARLSETFGLSTISAGGFTTALVNLANFIIGVVIPAWVQWIGFLAGGAATAFSAWVTYIQTAYAAWQTFSGFIQSDVVPALLAINNGITVIVGGLITFGEGVAVVFDILEAFGGLVSAVVNKALQAMAGLWQNVLLPALIKVGDVLNKVMFPIFQSLGKTVKDDVSPGMRDLGETILPMIQEGMDFVNEAVKRTISFFNSLASTVNSLSLPPWLQMHSPPPLATALNLVAGGANTANTAIQGMMNNLASGKWSDIRTQVFDLVDDMQDEGHYAAMGYGQSTGHAIKHAFVRAFNESFEGIMAGTIDAATLEAVTKREAGAYAERVSGNFDKIIRTARAKGSQLIAAMQAELLEALPGLAGNLSGLAGTFAGMLNEQIGSLETARKKVEELTKAQIKNAEFVGKTDEEFQKNTEAIAKNNAEFEAMRATRAGMIALLEQFLKGGSDELFKFDFAPALVGVDHVMMDRLQVQEQLNYLLAEQTAQEEEITRQKEAQQKLSFLQAQVDLIKLGQGLGGNLFEGITFGLNASIDDLLAATNNVVEAMIGQIDTTLGIASPSKVMFDKFRDQVGGGMVRGLMAVRPMLGSVAGAMLDPLTGGGVTNNRTTNNYFNQTVNTRAESSTVIGDFRSLQLMAGT